MNNPVGLLSGGQRQALTLLVATMVTPKLLLLDEHTAVWTRAPLKKFWRSPVRWYPSGTSPVLWLRTI